MFGKVISAIPTPFDKEDNIDTLTLEQYLINIGNSGSSAIVAGGSTGEGTSLSLEERLYLFELCKKLAPSGLKVIANIGTNNTNQTINLVCMADFLDLDGYLCIVPYYVLPTQEGIFQHFKAIADATDKPIILYNCPKRCGCNIEANTVLRLVKECPNIVGIKHASKDMKLISEIRALVPDFLIYVGEDSSLLDGLNNGADGTISVISNLIGMDVKEIIDNHQKGVKDESLIEYYDIMVELLSCSTNPIPLKYILSKKYSNFKHLRLPLTKLDYDKRIKIDKILGLN
ncbi:MAG: 4-hydroxy-tetrahydrodipicolinate synthase [Bacilli bacterium]|nr:4-hydroxy-tetrahydrodipicolinate synthase [Bacilli bacterium]